MVLVCVGWVLGGEEVYWKSGGVSEERVLYGGCLLRRGDFDRGLFFWILDVPLFSGRYGVHSYTNGEDGSRKKGIV